MTLQSITTSYQKLVTVISKADGLPLLALRLYLVPIFWIAGTNKLAHFDSTVYWFEHGLSLPFPWLMAALATWTEIIGAILLLAGFGVRLISIPLIITMAVAIFTIHWPHGWQAIADPSSFAANDHAREATQRLKGFLDWLQQNHPGRYNYITEYGKPVILNNGIEFATTYLLMLGGLFFYGAGRYLSLDFYLNKFMIHHNLKQR